MNPHASIGIFDSGFGGLTIMKAISALLPHENIVYLGDTAHLPYGTKSRETIIRYTHQNIDFLLTQNVKAVVIACHTACCHAFDTLEEKFSLPLVGVTHASLEPLVRLSPKGKIGILGTRGTIASKTYETLIRDRLPTAEIIPLACQLFVNLVEEGYQDHPLTTLAIQEYLRPLKGKMIESLLLGCTHFPLLASKIQEEVGDSVSLINPGIHCAEALQALLATKDLLNTQTTPPVYRFYVSDDPQKFKELGSVFLGQPIPEVEQIHI